MKQTNKENLKKKSALKIVYSHDLKRGFKVYCWLQAQKPVFIENVVPRS